MRKLTGVILLFCLALWGCGSARPVDPQPAPPAESESAEAAQSQAPTEPLYIFVSGCSLEEAGWTLELPRLESTADPNGDSEIFLSVYHFNQQCFENQLDANGSYTALAVEVADWPLAYNPYALRFFQCYKASDFANERCVARFGDELWDLDRLRELQVAGSEELLICDFTDCFNAATYGSFADYLSHLQKGNPHGYDYAYLQDVFNTVAHFFAPEQNFSLITPAQ